MQDKNNLYSGETVGPPILILFTVVLAYTNSLFCSWHLDDVINILNNTPLHLRELNLKTITGTFFAYPENTGIFYRPISCLTFGLNWFFNEDNVFGYHLVNLAVHLISTLFLYKTIISLLDLPVFGKKYQTSRFFIAVVATLLWALNPVNTQAVTYIVQRMTSMAGMFYIIGIWAFIQGRKYQNETGKIQFIYYLASCVAFLCAIGSKEHAVTFPIILLIIEFLFFQRYSDSLYRNSIYLLLCIAVIICTGIVLLGSPDRLISVFSSYENRSFSLLERVLTESRIMLWYLSILFYPSPSRLSIEHYTELSTSLFSPASTFFSITGLTILIALGFIQRRKKPTNCLLNLFLFRYPSRRINYHPSGIGI